MKHVPILVLGATTAGAAMALAKPDQVMIVERSILTGHEFLDSLNIRPCGQEQVKTTLTRDLIQELIHRNLLNEAGEIHAPRIASVLASRLRKSGAAVLLLTEVVSVKAAARGFAVQLFNADGLTEIMADRIIDTTSEGFQIAPDAHPPIQRSICAMLSLPDGARILTFAATGGLILHGRFSNEYVLKVNLMDDDSLTDARGRLHDFWMRHRSGLPDGCQIAAVASTLAIDFNITADHHEMAIQPGWQWIPSASFSDFLLAFDGGARCLSAV